MRLKINMGTRGHGWRVLLIDIKVTFVKEETVNQPKAKARNQYFSLDEASELKIFCFMPNRALINYYTVTTQCLCLQDIQLYIYYFVDPWQG